MPLKDPLGHPTRPWQPKGEYPWKQPYSATMLMYLTTDHKFYSARYLNYSVNSGRLNKEGLFTQKVGCGLRECLYDHYRDVMQYDEDPGGTVGTAGLMYKFFMIYHTPAESRGTSQLKFVYLNSPVAPWRMTDTWNYAPNLRRVTRSQGGNRQDEILGTPLTSDDNGERNVWEEEHSLIGEDVLYMQILDPQIVAPNRQFNTGDFAVDGEWLARNLDPNRGEERLSPYRPDGGIECWVVLSQWARRTEKFDSHVYPDPKQYYLKYRLVWIEKVTKTPVREEQYDHDNRLIKHGFSFNAEFFAGGFVNGGSYQTQYHMYDYRRHFRSWGAYTQVEVGPKARAPGDWFTPEHLSREYFWKELKAPLLKEAKDFPPPPELYRVKFPQYRKGASDWISKEEMDYMTGIWREHGFSDEEIEAMMNGDGVLRKDGKIIPVRRPYRPAFLHGKPLPVKFPTNGVR